MDQLQTKYLKLRNQWLEEVSNDCHEYAVKTDLDFYVFQTPCENYNPELLIIGINPGGMGAYSKKLLEKGYGKRPAGDLGYSENTLVQKPEWETGKGSDVLRERMRRVFNERNNLNVLGGAVMMNMFYFNTHQAKDIYGVANSIRDYCVRKTIEFIEILNPQNILFLTTDKRLLKQSGVHLTGEILEGNIKKGVLNNRSIHAMPHYGWFRGYSSGNCEKMAKTLGHVLAS